MAVGSSDEAIDTFTIFTSLPRENAIAWLQVGGMRRRTEVLNIEWSNRQMAMKLTRLRMLSSTGAVLRCLPKL